jgi:hypothetical protein
MHTGKVDKEHVMWAQDKNDWLAGHIVTVPAHQQPGSNHETARRHNEWIPESQIFEKVTRGPHIELITQAMQRIHNH